MSSLVPLFVLLGLFGFITFIAILRSIRIVPTKVALVVERLGKFSKILEPGFHLLLPFIDKVRYRHSLKEQAVDEKSLEAIDEEAKKICAESVEFAEGSADPSIDSLHSDVYA